MATQVSAVTRDYFQRYDISHIALQMEPGVVESAQGVCKLTINFAPGYQVQFNSCTIPATCNALG